MIIHPSPRKHNEFSFEDQVVTFWKNGFRMAELRIMTGEFIDFSEDSSEEYKDELFNRMINFYNEL